MATFLRPLSYRYQWLYDSIAKVAALGVGGEKRFRHLALADLEIRSTTQVLDLCCGGGQTTQFLVVYSNQVIGLDASPRALTRAKANVPQADYVQAWAEDMPFPAEHFDVVHTSAAMHEMKSDQRVKIFQEVYRVLKTGGVFTMVDFHRPQNLLFWPGLALFLWAFETETAWQWLKADLPEQLRDVGFHAKPSKLYAGGSLQVIQSIKTSN